MAEVQEPTVERPMDAIERVVLEWLADRPSAAKEATRVAEAVDRSLPKVQAALGRLRERRFVAYYDGHPGMWAITAAGVAHIKLTEPADRTERLLLAVEVTDKLLNGRTYVATEHVEAAGIIARLALREASSDA